MEQARRWIVLAAALGSVSARPVRDYPVHGTVSAVEVYWFDDTGSGECRTPASWRILYREGGAWKPVETTDGYGVEKDRYNRVGFKPVTTSALRLEVTLQPQWSAGIQEWKVN